MLATRHGTGCVFERRKPVLLGIFTIQQSTTWLYDNHSSSVVLGVVLAVALAEALVVVLAVALTVALTVARPLDVTQSID